MLRKYKNKAVFTNLEDEFIQEARCQEISKEVVTGSFTGGGKVVNSQTLDLITNEPLSAKIKPYITSCLFKGKKYIVVTIQSHNIKPISRQKVKNAKQSIISLQ